MSRARKITERLTAAPAPDVSGIDAHELDIGIQVEMQRGAGENEAWAIAVKNLQQDPHFYTRPRQ